MKKELQRILILSVVSTLICQLGMALTCLNEGSVMHMPTVKNTLVVFFVSLCMSVGVELLLEKVLTYTEKTSAVLTVFDAFLLLVLVQSLLHPLIGLNGEVAYRYPMLCAMAVGVLSGELVLHRTKPSFSSILTRPDFSAPETVYTVLLLALGLVICLEMPRTTMTGIDDDSHYRYALYYSEGIYSAFDDSDIRLFYAWDDSIADREDLGRVYVESDIFFWTPIRVGYTGPTLGLWAGILLQLDTGGRFFLGRIGGLLLYAVIAYYAIRRLVNGKHLLGLILLAPVSIQYAVTYSYDAWLLAFTALSFAYFFGALQRPEEKLTEREIIIMAGAMCIGTWPKMPYAVLLAALLFMPKDKFTDRSQQKRYYLTVALCILFEFTFTMLTSFGAGDVVDARGGEEVSGYSQVSYILSNPMEFSSTMVRHILSYLEPIRQDSYLTTFTYFGSTSAYLILLPAMILAALADSTVRVSAPLTRVFGLLTLLALVGVISLSMYFVYTAVGATTIAGVQNRYKLQLLFPFFMFLFSGWFAWTKKNETLFNVLFYAVSSGVLLYNMAVVL